MIFLDMDETCVQFVNGVARVTGLTVPDPWPPGVYDLGEAFGAPNARIWRMINAEGSRFWRELQPYEWFRDLFDGLCRLDNVCFCSTPSSPASAAGKLEWIQEYAPGTEYVLTEHKEILAHSGAVLVDDREDICSTFRAWGGKAVLFPRPWNNADGEVEDVLERVGECFRKNILTPDE